jgi:nucleotide-binding universal stress UspA family protein
MDFWFDDHASKEDHDAAFGSPDSLGGRSMYQRLMVLIGDEPWTQIPVAFALHLAARLGADVHFLINLTTPRAWGMPDLMASWALDVAALEMYGTAELTQASALAEEMGVSYTTSMRWGSIPETIRHMTALTSSDLIVMGPYVRAGFEPLLGCYGARRVAAHVGLPVLVVPPCIEVTDDSVDWQRALVVPGDNRASEAAMAYSMRLAKEEQAALCLLQVAPQGQRAAARMPVAYALAEAQVAASGVSYDVRQAKGDTASAIVRAAEEQQCDIVILGTPSGSLWSRLLYGCPIKAALNQTTRPVLLIPANAQGAAHR